MNQELDVLAAHHTQLVGWAVHQFGRALFIGSLVGLAAIFVIGALALPLGGLICATYLLLASAPDLSTRSTDDTPRPFVTEE